MEKNNSAGRKNFLIIGLLALLAAVILSYLLFLRTSHAGTTMTIGSKTISIELADTPEKQEQGLSDREPLTSNQGMLFTGGQSYYRPKFWMKNMRFPLDIIWIKDGRVAGFEKYLPPEGANPRAIYEPLTPINQVLEVKAGFVDDNNIKVGDRAVIK